MIMRQCFIEGYGNNSGVARIDSVASVVRYNRLEGNASFASIIHTKAGRVGVGRAGN